MKISVTFRHMEPSEAIKQLVEDKLARVEKYFPDPIRAQVVLAAERHLHHVDITLKLADGAMITGKETADDMYTAVDLVMDKLDRQVRRYKDKLNTRRAAGGQPPQDQDVEGVEGGSDGPPVS